MMNADEAMMRRIKPIPHKMLLFVFNVEPTTAQQQMQPSDVRMYVRMFAFVLIEREESETMMMMM